MGLFDFFKKKEAAPAQSALDPQAEKPAPDPQAEKPAPDPQALQAAIQKTCNNLRVHVRDADLPEALTHKYQRGMIIRERGFVDATALCGGLVKAHRYMILSNHMMPMLQFEGDKQWGLCLANKDSRFLVLGKGKEQGKEQGKRLTVLLHLDNETWKLFRGVDMNFSVNLLDQCFKHFMENANKPPIASVATEEWFARCAFPLGMSDEGAFFPLEDTI